MASLVSCPAEAPKSRAPIPLSNLALIRSHEERALAALGQLGAGSWLAYDIAWKSDELSVDEVHKALSLAEKRGRCRKVQAGRTTRWALVARRSDDAESK